MQFSYQFPERSERLVLVSSGGLSDEVHALLRPHLQHLMEDTSLAKMDFGHSHVLNVAREVNLITELRGPRKT